MFYNNLKKIIKKFPTIWKFLFFIKTNLVNLSRLKDVLMMMILLHIWPEQTYRFSTRKLLPNMKNRHPRDGKLKLPYNYLKSKTSDIAKIDALFREGQAELDTIMTIPDFEEHKEELVQGFWMTF